MSKKIGIIVLSAVLVIGLSSWFFIRSGRNNIRREHWYLNTARHTILDITETLETIFIDNEADGLENSLDVLAHDLVRLEYLLEDGGMMMANVYYYDEILGFEFISKVIEAKAGIDGVTISEVPFNEDGTLSEREIEFLRQLYEDMIVILDNMSEDHIVLDSDVTIHEFGELIDRFFDRWGIQTYQGRDDEFLSPYIEFIKGS